MKKINLFVVFVFVERFVVVEKEQLLLVLLFENFDVILVYLEKIYVVKSVNVVRGEYVVKKMNVVKFELLRIKERYVYINVFILLFYNCL